MDVKNLPETIEAHPTTDGAGFTQGKRYTFKRDHSSMEGSLYTTESDKGHLKIVGYEALFLGERSAHLWDGRNWKEAGHWRTRLPIDFGEFDTMEETDFWRWLTAHPETETLTQAAEGYYGFDKNLHFFDGRDVELLSIVFNYHGREQARRAQETTKQEA